MQPTPAGLALIEHARAILFAVERIAQDVAAFGSGVKGHVRLIATASAIAESLLLAGRRSLRFEQTLDHEHVGLPPTAAVHAICSGRPPARGEGRERERCRQAGLRGLML